MGWGGAGGGVSGRPPAATEPRGGWVLGRPPRPRRVYTQSHVDYVIEVVTRVARRAGELKGLRITEQPAALRHFTARFQPVGP